MKQKIFVKPTETTYCLLDGITFAQVPYWFPFYNTRDLKLNLLCPLNAPQQRLPLIIWICGGAWITMDRSAHTPFLLYFAQHGYLVASIEYRRSNSATFPAQLQDVKAAIRYLRAHAAQFGIDAERIAVMGESAGGYLAAMAGATGQTTEFDTGENLNQSSAVSAVVDYYGPADFSDPLSASFENAEGRARPEQMLLGYDPLKEPEKTHTAEVKTYLTKKAPPYFLLHGTADPFVPPEQSEKLYDALCAMGVPAELLELEHAGHAAPEFYQSEISARVTAFLDEILKPRKNAKNS
jgi:acetyl esterase/lipase